jgi:hypothetical protein
MAITRLTNHDSHQMAIHPTRGGKHYAALRCCQCDKHVQWLSKQDAQALESLNIATVNNTTDHKQVLSRGAKTTRFFSRGANTYNHQDITYMYEPKGPYLRELPVPNKFLRVSGVSDV